MANTPAGLLGEHGPGHRRACQMMSVTFEQVGGAAEAGHHTGKALGGGTGGELLVEPGQRRLAILDQLTGQQQLGGQFAGHLQQAALALRSRKQVDRLAHLQGIASAGSQRLAHGR
jgi:hypothetical protein